MTTPHNAVVIFISSHNFAFHQPILDVIKRAYIISLSSNSEMECVTMAENFSRGKLPWVPELGTRPTGFIDEVELRGQYEGRETYLDYCDCSNHNCHGLVARYADDHQLCRVQTLALREEAGMLLEIFLNMRSALSEMQASRLYFEFSLLNEPEVREDTWGQYEYALQQVNDALKKVIEMRDLLETTGVIYMFVEQDVENGYLQEKYRIEGCPVFAILMDEERLSKPALMSGKEDDDPAKQIADDLPEGKSFFDNDLLRNLFNGKLGDTGEAPPEG